MPRFLLKNASGRTVGIYSLANSKWETGDIVPTSPGQTLIVTEVIAAVGTELPVLVVKRA